MRQTKHSAIIKKNITFSPGFACPGENPGSPLGPCRREIKVIDIIREESF